MLLLSKAGWYKNMSGGMTNSHRTCILSKKELVNMSKDQFYTIIYS